jgi:hypothetical protein
MDPSCMQRGVGGSNSRSLSNNSLSHGPSHHHHGSYSHQRGHRGTGGVSSHGYPSGNSQSGRASGSALQMQSEGVLSRTGSSGYLHNSMNEYSSPGLSLGWHSSGSASLLGPQLHGSGSNGATRSGHGAMGAKRHRGLDIAGGAPAQAGPHHDALMELARENLLLKHQLHVATTEVGLHAEKALSVCLLPSEHLLH